MYQYACTTWRQPAGLATGQSMYMIAVNCSSHECCHAAQGIPAPLSFHSSTATAVTVAAAATAPASSPVPAASVAIVYSCLPAAVTNTVTFVCL